MAPLNRNFSLREMEDGGVVNFLDLIFALFRLFSFSYKMLYSTQWAKISKKVQFGKSHCLPQRVTLIRPSHLDHLARDIE